MSGSSTKRMSFKQKTLFTHPFFKPSKKLVTLFLCLTQNQSAFRKLQSASWCKAVSITSISGLQVRSMAYGKQDQTQNPQPGKSRHTNGSMVQMKGTGWLETRFGRGKIQEEARSDWENEEADENSPKPASRSTLGARIGRNDSRRISQQTPAQSEQTLQTVSGTTGGHEGRPAL